MRFKGNPELVMIDYLCESWARWAGELLEGIGWPKKSICGKMLEWHQLGLRQELLSPGPHDPPAGAQLVDRAVARLPHRLQQCIIVEYFSGGTSEMKARRIGIVRLEYRQRLQGALWALYGRLEGEFDAAGVARRQDSG